MKNQLTVLVLLIFGLSCTDHVKHGKTSEFSIPRGKMDNAIMVLKNATSMNGPAVGYAGLRTSEYDSYEWILKYGSDSLLNQLANYPNPYTRTYAFIALCHRNSTAAKKVFFKNISDSTKLNLFSGCEMSICELNRFWFSEIKTLVSNAELSSITETMSRGKDMQLECY